MSVLYVETAFTVFKLRFSESALQEVDFDVELQSPAESVSPLMQTACQQLEAYCRAPIILDLPLAPAGTEFQQRVWSSLRSIPPGEVRTYGDIAAELGTSARAVGNACRVNPIPLFIPCHRVVARSGPGGYAGQRQGRNLDLKRALLRHEGVEI